MGRAVLPLPNTPSWRGALLGEHIDDFTLLYCTLPCLTNLPWSQEAANFEPILDTDIPLKVDTRVNHSQTAEVQTVNCNTISQLAVSI